MDDGVGDRSVELMSISSIRLITGVCFMQTLKKNRGLYGPI